MEKDRRHTLNHYRHLLNSNLKQALKDKEITLQHLDGLNKIANQSFAMLDRVPNVADKIRTRMGNLILNIAAYLQFIYFVFIIYVIFIIEKNAKNIFY